MCIRDSYVTSVIICIITLYPMYYVVIKSISDPQISLTHPVIFYPQGLYFGSYEMILRDKDMWIAYGNTLIYVAATTALMILTSVIAAYPLVSKDVYKRQPSGVEPGDSDRGLSDCICRPRDTFQR